MLAFLSALLKDKVYVVLFSLNISKWIYTHEWVIVHCDCAGVGSVHVTIMRWTVGSAAPWKTTFTTL